ncbi:MAG: magnesium transporter [Thermoanaerobaculia bacterium]|nr:MAG: magnesium transporter [Thermoanaerobaculia bacterium]MBZ0102342.1 magnesium transporter [Thermoanaerobaculia bacterium]
MTASTRTPQALERGQRRHLILRLLRHAAERPARRLLTRLHPADIAQLAPLLTPDEQLQLWVTLLELRLAARTLRELDGEQRARVLAILGDEQVVAILGRLASADAADLLGELEPQRRDDLLARLDPQRAGQLTNLLRYGPATAGGLMDPDVPRFFAEETIAATLDRVRSLAEKRRLFYLYVVDERGHLLGIAPLWQLVSSAADRPLRDIVSKEVVSVRVDTPEEEVARQFSKYDLLLMPVVDEDGRLAGVITVDDVLDVVEERATEDLYRLANLDTQENLATPPVRSVRLRLPWLLVNLATAFLAAGVVSFYQETIAAYVVLAVFMPIVAGMGGNAGTQTLTIMVRGIALGEMEVRDAGTIVARQTLIGLLNGLLTGVVLALCALLWERNLVLAGVLAFAQTLNLTVAGFFGAAVPLFLERARLDPALGSSIFVTTATDVCGFLAFLGTATALLSMLQP